MFMQKVKDKINNHTLHNTEFCDLAYHYGLLPELPVNVLPQLQELPLFYDEDLPPDYEFVPETPTTRWEEESSKDGAVQSFSCIDDILSGFEEGHICFVGPAGSGKTTLMKIIGRGTLDRKYAGLRGVDTVCYIRCDDAKKGDEITIGDLLFRGPNSYLKDTEIRKALKLARTMPDKVLFLLDSLDTLRFSLDGVYKDELEERSSPEVILWSFLSGKLFPGCRIITSSREHVIRNFMGPVRPGKVFGMMGFSNAAIKSVIDGYVGKDRSSEIMKDLETKTPSQLSLCNSPAMLVYTLIAMKNELTFLPNTMSRIMITVIQNMLRSPHIHQEDAPEVVEKLKRLSYSGILHGDHCFQADELRELGLKPEMATDLAVLAPQGKVLYFPHKSLQELLAAFYAAEMSKESFESLLLDTLHTPLFSVVRRFLCGILLDKALFSELGGLFDEDKNAEEKRKVLKRSLLEQLCDNVVRVKLSPGSRKNKADLLELFLSLRECGDCLSDIVGSFTGVIDMHDCPLSVSDVHALGSVGSRFERITLLDLRNCSLTSSALCVFGSTLQDSDVKVIEWVLNRNASIGTEGLSAVGRTCVQCSIEKLSVGSCKATSQALRAFHASLGFHQLQRLGLSEDRTAKSEDVEAVAALLPNVTDEIWLWSWQISQDDLEVLQDQLNTKPSNLVIYHGHFGELRTGSHSSSESAGAGEDEKEEEEIRHKVTIDGKAVQVTIGRCAVIFPEGAVTESTTLEFVLSNGIAPLLPGFFPISPHLDITPSMEFDATVYICLSTWCSTEHDGVLVRVMRREDKSSLPTEVHNADGKTLNGEIRFGVSEFGSFRAYVLRTHHNLVTYRILPKIFCNLSEKFILTTCTDDLLTMRKCIREMLRHGNHLLPITLNTMSFSQNEAQLTLRCHGKAAFKPNESEEKIIDNEFQRRGFKNITFTLHPIPQPGSVLDIDCGIKHDDKTLEGSFKILWVSSDSTSGTGKDEPSRHLEYDNTRHRDVPDNHQLDDLEYGFTELTTEKEIGPDGGVISLEECSVTIPRNSVATTHNLTLSISVDFRNQNLPPDITPISPRLEIRYINRLRVPAVIKIPIWFASDGFLDVARIYKSENDKNGGFSWQQLETVIKNDGNSVEFHVEHFCSLVVAVYKRIWRDGSISLSQALFCKHRNFQSIVCYFKPECLIKQKIEELEQRGYELIHTDCFKIKTSDEGNAVIKLEPYYPQQCKFEPNFKILSLRELNEHPKNTLCLTFLLLISDANQKEVDVMYTVNGQQPFHFAVRLAQDGVQECEQAADEMARVCALLAMKQHEGAIVIAGNKIFLGKPDAGGVEACEQTADEMSRISALLAVKHHEGAIVIAGNKFFFGKLDPDPRNDDESPNETH